MTPITGGLRILILFLTLLGSLSIGIFMGVMFPQNAPLSAPDLSRYTSVFELAFSTQVTLCLVGGIVFRCTHADRVSPSGAKEIARWSPIVGALWLGVVALWFGMYVSRSGPNLWVGMQFCLESVGHVFMFVGVFTYREDAPDVAIPNVQDFIGAMDPHGLDIYAMDPHVFETTVHTTESVLQLLGHSLEGSMTTMGPASTQVRSKMTSQVAAMQDYLLHTPPLPYDRDDMVSHISHIRDLPHVAGVWASEASLIVALHALTMDSPTTGQVHRVGGALVQIAPTVPYVAVQPVLGLRHPYLLNTVADLSPIQATLAEQYAEHDLVGIVLTLCNYLQSPDPTFPGLGDTLAQYPLATMPQHVAASASYP